MKPEIRKLMLNIIHNYSEFHEVTSCLYFLDTHFPENKLEAALKYLLAMGLKGDKFVQWFKFDCQGSALEMHRKLLTAVERPTDKSEIRKVLAWKDMRL